MKEGDDQVHVDEGDWQVQQQSRSLNPTLQAIFSIIHVSYEIEILQQKQNRRANDYYRI